MIQQLIEKHEVWARNAQTMTRLSHILIALILFTALGACSSEPQYVDPEAHERTVQLNEKYGPIIVGTWHYERIGEQQRYFEKLSFEADGTLTGLRRWQTRKMVTIDGEQRWTDWEDIDPLTGTFSGTWSLRYLSPEGADGEKHNCLQLTANYDNAEYVAYGCRAIFDYADETTLRFVGNYVNDDDGWMNFRRGDDEPSF